MATLVLIVLAFMRGNIVPAGVYHDMKRDRDDWKEIALSTVDTGEKAIGLIERRRRDASRRS